LNLPVVVACGVACGVLPINYLNLPSFPSSPTHISSPVSVQFFTSQPILFHFADTKYSPLPQQPTFTTSAYFGMTSPGGIDTMTPPAIPQRISSLLPQVTQQEIVEYDKQVEKQKSTISLLSIKSSVSEFLEEKFKECEYDLTASLAKLSALQQAVTQGTIGQEEYYEAAEPFFEYQKERFNDKKHLSKHRRFLEANISEEVDSKKLRFDEPGIDFYERAYANSIVPRVMGASAKQTKSNFDTKRFRDDLLKAYNAFDPGSGVPKAWCHISHVWYPKSQVKAAHLVPKSLTDPEIGYLFGVEQVPKDFFYDWRLGK
jgi:hypothetical protein